MHGRHVCKGIYDSVLHTFVLMPEISLCDIPGITAKAPYETAHRGERHMRTEFSDFVMRAFVLAYPKTSGSMQE